MDWARLPLKILALPFMALWVVLRLARMPLNLLLWAISQPIEYLMMPSSPYLTWPSWRSLWNGP